MPEKNILLKSFKSPLVGRILSYFLAVLIAFAAVGVFIWAMGFPVFEAYATILSTSFRTPNGIVQTLIKFGTLTLLALGFTVPYATMKFNIGLDGQFMAGAMGAAAVGILGSNLPAYILMPAVLLGGILAGALWGLVPAFLLYKYNVNEILTTVLMNFISLALVDFICTKVWSEPGAGHPTTVAIGQGGLLPLVINNPPLHIGVVFAIMVAVGVYIYIGRTSGGYDLIATGANPRAANVFGVNVRIMFLMALVLGGALAGFAGSIEVAGVQHRLILDMQGRYQVLGIIIGLIAKGNSLAVPFVALFISILEVGASAMQRTLMIPVEMVFIVEALILIFVLLSDVVKRR